MSFEEDTPVPIIQDDWEFEMLLDIYREWKPERVLEVGTYTGGTLYWWLHEASPGTHVVSVDMYEDADNSLLYNDWCAPEVTWEIVRGNSNEPDTAKQAAQYGPFDWIFVDAGHRDKEIRADVSLYLPLAAEEAIVAFHDVTDYGDDLPQIQVAGVWSELKKEHRSIEISTPGAGGIGVLFL